MTSILNYLIIRDAARASSNLESISTIYHPFISFINSNLNELANNPKDIQNIDNYLLTRTNIDFVIDFFNRLHTQKNIFSEAFESTLDFYNMMQHLGNNVRKTGSAFTDEDSATHSGNQAILSEIACRYLKLLREKQKDNNQEDHRTYFVIECLRNPAEVNYFRKRFAEFYLLSIYRDEKHRYKAAKKLNLSISDTQEIDKVDQGGSFAKEIYKQNIKECVNLADIAITNDGTFDDLYNKLLQYFSLIKFPGCFLPTHEERNMHLAYSASLNSACICRQVGAVITKDGYVVGLGWNDAESNNVGCLYRHKRDARDIEHEYFPLGYDESHEKIVELMSIDKLNEDQSFCLKDEYATFKKNIRLPNEISEECSKLINQIKTKSLQECRSLHAEENAILQTTKSGSGPLTGATIYTTTFPCELCTKKILQVGIRKIIYCEPYPKSISQSVFFKEHFIKIEIVPFDGVKSPSFFRLFKSSLPIKDLQQINHAML
jgi:dCMP deaminase